MNHLYKLLGVIIMALAAIPTGSAVEWSFDWPISSSADKADGYPNGFYNFSSGHDPDITSIDRTLNGRAWTLTFDKGTKLTYLASSGQAVGASGGFTNGFQLISSDFNGKIKSITVTTRTKVADAMLSITVGGSSYLCNGSAETCYTVSGTTPADFLFEPGADGAGEGRIEINFTIPGAANNAYVKKLTVEYEETVSNVEAPVFTPAPGTFDEPVTVTATAPEGTAILYTIDGSNPLADGNRGILTYESPILVSSPTTLRAVAFDMHEYSAITEGRYVIRQSPDLKFLKDELTIELLEEDLALIDNPHDVSPIKYKSSNPQVAWADSKGHVYTYSVGTTEISAVFEGNDEYTPQTITLPVTVVAKEPLAGLTVTPGEGAYDGVTTVSISCTDPRAAALWYHIGDSPMGVDDLGLLDEYTINPSTSMTIDIDHSCVLTVQAVGLNVWSEPQVARYTINLPLQAAFEGGDNLQAVYRNGFDSAEEAEEWTVSTGSNWQLAETSYSFQALPPFSAINPDSKLSLYHRYANTNDIAVTTSPDIVVPRGGKVRFYAAFNPVWIYDGNLMLYVCENVDGATPVKIWDAFLTSQEAATDDVKWNQYTVDLDEYAGKEVYFAFAYELTNGDDVLIDDFEVVAPVGDGTTVTVNAGSRVAFRDLSTGEPQEWAWQFPGADTETSDQQNPVVTYSTPGTYDVTLTVRKGDETSTATRNGYIVVRTVAPTAAIGLPEGVYHSPEAGIVVPLMTALTFTDASVGGPTRFDWTLPGTDLQTSTDRDVTVKYLEEGMYDVDLTVSNDAGTSSTYVYGVKAGGKSLAWNISAAENPDLGKIALGWYGNYGGSNSLDMDAFAEKFEAPAQPVTISGVNVYFACTDAITPSAEITVSVAKADENGLPGDAVAGATMTVAELVDASETYNDPTEFVFDEPVKMEGAFFVTIAGFPNNADNTGYDDIAMYALRRGTGGSNTAYHLMKEYDDLYRPTGESKWYAQVDDPCSFAIAPLIEFHKPSSGITVIESAEDDSEAVYYNLQGIRVNPDNLTPGIYIRKRGAVSDKVRVK